MSDYTVTGKFLFWVASVVLAFGIFGSLGKLTIRMATAAIEAQQHDQMSYGSFSRKLWSNHLKH